MANLIDRVAKALGPGPHLDYNQFLAAVEAEADRRSVELTGKRLKLLQTALAEKNETAAPLIRKRSRPKRDADAAGDALYAAIMLSSRAHRRGRVRTGHRAARDRADSAS